MAQRGPKPKVSVDDLFFYASDLYRDFRLLLDGTVRYSSDRRKIEAWKPILSNHADWLNDHIDDEDEREEVRQAQEREAVDDIATAKKIPGEPDVINALLKARTPAAVRQISEDATVFVQGQAVPNWPVRDGSRLPHTLSEYAEQFIAAREDRRFPGSDRPTNKLKQLWFLSRALAGATFGLSPRTSIDLIPACRPEQLISRSRQRQKRTRNA